MDVTKALEMKIDKLKSILSRVDTENFIGMVATEFGISFDLSESVFNKTQLNSPFKQYLYAVGLLLSIEKVASTEEDYFPMDEIKKTLNEIVDIHGQMFFSDDDKEIDEKRQEAIKVSMPVFLNYFNTNFVTYEEQVVERVGKWFSPFSDVIREKLGVSVDDLIKIFNFIRDYLQNRFDRIKELQPKVKKDHQAFVQYMMEKGVSFEQASKDLHFPNTVQLMKEITLSHQVEVQVLINEFGEEITNSFIDLFTLERMNRDFYYYTEQNPFAVSPIWRKSDSILFVPFYKQIIHAILLRLTSVMEESELNRSFYKNRDNNTEEKTLDIFRRFFGKKAKYHQSVFETNDSQNEHDLLIKYKDILLIIEVKATKVKEPFRDPYKAYQRIKRDFKSDGGIQKAYDQGLKLKKHILSNEKTILFDDKGNELVHLEKSEIKKIYNIVVTAESFGIIATNLSYLLNKPEDEPYPWAINIYDLETAVDAFLYKKLPIKDFFSYLDERELYHEQFTTSDELEILGFYLENGSMSKVVKDKQTYIVFDPDTSDIFDEIYFEKRGLIKRKNSPVSDQSNPKKSKKQKKHKKTEIRKSKKKNRKKK